MTIIRPKITLLDNEHKKQIFEEAKLILKTQGIFLENKEASSLFTEQGLNKKDDRYLIPADLIEKSLQRAPKEITLYDREGKKHLSLRDDEPHFDPGSAAIFILDENSGIIREALEEDFIRFTKIVEHLKYIDAQSTALVYADVPREAQDWHRLYVALRHCYKPIVTGTFRKESFQIMKELLLTCRSSEEDLAKKPLAIFDACPSPPLRWSDLTTQSVIDAARSLIPSEFISMPQSGANAPVTLLGSITQHCAESLAGVVIAQLARQDAPLIWGGSPAPFDMRQGTHLMGAIEAMMINMGDAEMGKFLGLPTHAYMGLSDSKVPDAQGGLESGMGSLLAALAGINMISGPGMIDFESCQSIEKLLIDNEIVGMAKRFIRGIEDHGSPFAADILADYEEKQELLSHPSTLKFFRKEFFFPSPIIDRTTRERWKAAGSKSTRLLARDQAKKLATKPSPRPIDEELALELDSLAKERL
ncbi:MAG: trimethylamine methyltransferase family protein [Candidatus Hodarchaeota archaeon]